MIEQYDNIIQPFELLVDVQNMESNRESGSRQFPFTPALDTVLSRPSNPAHSEFGGIGNAAHIYWVDPGFFLPSTADSSRKETVLVQCTSKYIPDNF